MRTAGQELPGYANDNLVSRAMGNRANYVIKQDGQLRIFYSHSAAESIALDVFWGPETAEVIIRANQETGRWLDDIWAEAGIALDHDRKAAAYFGGGELFAGESFAEDKGKTLRQAFSALVETLWGEAGWTIRLVSDLPDIAEFVGLDRSVAEAERIKPLPVPLEELNVPREGTKPTVKLAPARPLDECFALIRQHVLQVTAAPWKHAPASLPLGALAEKRFDELVHKVKPRLIAARVSTSPHQTRFRER
jgi:hypothetical protein